MRGTYTYNDTCDKDQKGGHGMQWGGGGPRGWQDPVQDVHNSRQAVVYTVCTPAATEGQDL